MITSLSILLIILTITNAIGHNIIKFQWEIVPNHLALNILELKTESPIYQLYKNNNFNIQPILDIADNMIKHRFPLTTTLCGLPYKKSGHDTIKNELPPLLKLISKIDTPNKSLENEFFNRKQK